MPVFREGTRTTQHQEPIPTIEALVADIQAAGMDSHVIIYSDYLNQVQKLNELDPALTVWAKPIDYVPPASDVPGVDGIVLPASLMTADNVVEYHAVGHTVIRQRTAESLDDANAFLATGADSLMTGSPQLMIKRCRALGRASSSLERAGARAQLPGADPSSAGSRSRNCRPSL